MKQKISLFHNLLFILPIMFYYGMESLIVSLFISVILKIFFINIIDHIGYFQIVGGYWIVKMLMFDIFKLTTIISSNDENDENETDK